MGHGMNDEHDVLVKAGRVWSMIDNDVPGWLNRLFKEPVDRFQGRYFPLARPYFWFVYTVFGTNFVAWQWWNCGLTILTVQLAYTLARGLCKHPFAPLASGVSFLIFWPTLPFIFSQHLLEIPLTPLLLGGLVLVREMERRGNSTGVDRLFLWSSAVLTVLCVAATLGLKETSLAFLPSFVLLAGWNVWRGPRPCRKAFGFVLTAIVVVGAVFALAILRSNPDSGKYTSAYEIRGIVSMIENLFVWRAYIFTGFGPLVLLGVASLSVRVVWAVRERRMEADLVWRLALFGLTAFTVAIIAPWEYLTPRLILPVMGPFAILLVWEGAEVWGRLKSVKAARGGERTVPTWVVVGLAVGGAAIWVSPSVMRLTEFGFMFVKAIAVAAFLGSAAAAVRGGALRQWRGGVLDGRLRTLGFTLLILCVGHLAIYNLPMVYSAYGHARMNTKVHMDALAFLGETVPPGGRVVMIYPREGNWQTQEVRKHFAMCLGRDDLELAVVTSPEQPIRPEDYLLVFWLIRPEQVQPFSLGSRVKVEISDGGTVFNADLAQPGNLVKWGLGYIDPARFKLYNGVLGRKTQTDTVYLPL